MTEDEKDKAITEAVETCLDKAVSIMEDNQKEGIRGMFCLYVDGESIAVRSVGHSMALDSAYHKALQYIIAKLLQLPEPQEGR